MTSKTNLKLFLKQVKKKKYSLNNYNNLIKNSINYYLTNNNLIKLYREKKKPVFFYIITIKYTKVNTLLNVTDSHGQLLFFSSAGQLGLIKKKTSKKIIIKKFLNLLLSELNFLRTKPIALHLKNITYYRWLLIKLIKKKFFIQTIKNFNIFPHNGCRQKKKKRKKIRSFAKKINFYQKKFRKKKFAKNKIHKKLLKKEEVAEGFKAVDCKSIEFISS